MSIPQRCVIVLPLLILAISPARAQDPGELLPAVAARLEAPPTIDGVLDDPAWKLVTPVDDFTQSNPVAGGSPSERTELFIVYDSRHLYIGVRCHDSGGRDAILARQTRRDQGSQGDDAVYISIDTNEDGLTGYYFDVTAAGARTDGLIDHDGALGNSWDGIWEARTSIDDGGWSAEIAIPFATMTLDRESPTWKVNAERSIARKHETVRWRNWRREGSVRQVSQAGTVEGFERLEQGRGLTLKPFISLKEDIKGHELDVEPGADLFYRLNSQITLALTYNTDFAETEVDDRVVNLTRFPVFFPERRDFFLEDAGVFDFGGIHQSPKPFFSRRIGIVGGEEKGILAGARLTGRTGALRFGAMSVQMDHDEVLGDKNLSVLRLQRDVLDESSIGMIVTNGDPARRGGNTLVGLDFNYRDSDAFAGTGLVTADVFAQGTYTTISGVDDDNADTSAIGGRFGIDRDPWDCNAFFARIGEHYDPALGFVSRRGRYEHDYSAGYTWRFDEAESIIRSVRLSTNTSVYTYLDSTIDTLNLNLPAVAVSTHSGDAVSGRLFFTRDNLVDPFEIVDGVTIPVGTYDNLGTELSFGTTASRPVAAGGTVRRYGFYSGDRWDYTATLALRPGPYFSANAAYSINDIDLPEGSFLVRQFSMRASVQFTPDLSWDNTVQWDNRSDDLGLNSRVRWEFHPGHELFVVYNEGYNVDGGSFRSERRAVTIKLGLAFQF
ncbi:MAG: carbohydrate binding family 9 domain-containing protein [Phycisphaeraceae bacterium]|nr:MAG: carbohydrate binding family 9 domain-containing protein [Phycisphaeraceae bacterium]